MKIAVSTLLLLFCSLSLMAQQQNILFIASDDLKTSIGPYMNIDEHTPHLDRLASEGYAFQECTANTLYVDLPELLL